jgi:NAD(P)-dependent dehydrogenase (short-subunit alcohol dehydrogenase family)
MDDFIDQVVLVTGAGRGIGRVIAEAFATLGAIVAANDINPLNLDETVEHITATGARAKAYVFDIAKRMPIEAMIAQVVNDFGRIDILVNNATVEPDASILDMDEWEFHRTMDVNLGGPFFSMQQVGRKMRQQGSGEMVNIASISGRGYASKGHAAYVASKTGLVGLTREAALEFSPYNIRVNAVCPDTVEPEMINTQNWDRAELDKWLEGFPQLHLGAHAEVVGLVLFLCSKAAASLTGHAFGVRCGKVRD